MRYLVFLFFVLQLSAQAQTVHRFLGLRAGANISTAQLMSRQFDTEAQFGGQFGLVYAEDYYSTGFDCELSFAWRRALVTGLNKEIKLPQLSVAGRFHVYTSSRKRGAFHFGYQINYNFVSADSKLKEVLTGPELGFSRRVTKHFFIETSVYVPVAKVATLEWEEEVAEGDNVVLVKREEPVFLLSAMISFKYFFADSY